MNTIMRYLTGALLSAAAFGTARPQNATQEVSLNEIKAQQRPETIYASAPCQLVRENARNFPSTFPLKGSIFQRYKIDPKTLIQDLNTLMDMSDEVVLGGSLGGVWAPSPSGQGATTYIEVSVITSFKGSRHTGDTLTFGLPGGTLLCEPDDFVRVPTRFDFYPEDSEALRFGTMPIEFKDPNPATDSFAYLLFLRPSQGNEIKSVKGLRPVAGEGVQGIFLLPINVRVSHPPNVVYAEDFCFGLGGQANVPRCKAILEASQSPVVVPYAHDPLAKKYGGMPTSQFLREVQSMASGQGVAEKSSLR